MSAAEIIAELPKLTEVRQVAIARRIRELEETDATQFLRRCDPDISRVDEAEFGACPSHNRVKSG